MTASGLLLFLLSACLYASVTQAQLTNTDEAYNQFNYRAQHFSHWQPNTALDMLIHIPGVTLQQDSEGQPLLQMHGMGNRYLAILVDGHPLSGDSINNAVSARQIPASMIERIEVTRSGRADLDSRGGAAGTINLVLRNSDQQDHTLRLYAGALPLNSAAAVNGSQLFGQHQFYYAFDWQKSRNKVHATEIDRSEEQSRSKDRWNSQQADDRTSYYLGYSRTSSQTHFTSTLLHLKNSEENRSSGRVDPNLRNLQNQNGDENSVRWRTQIASDWSHMRWQSSLIAEVHNKTQQLQGIQVKQDDNRWQFTANLQEVVDEHHWQAGLNVKHMRRQVKSDQRININESTPLSYEVDDLSWHFFGLDRWHLTDSTRFEAGFRMETYSLKQTDQLSESNTSETTGDTYWLPSFHLKHQYNDELELQFSTFQSVRQPELTARIPYRIRQQDVELRGNGNLQAELVSAAEATILYHDRCNMNQFRLSLFQRTINNAILNISRQEPLDNGTVTVIEPINSEVNGRLRGLEVDSRIQLSPDLSLTAEAGIYTSFMRATTERSSQPLAHQPQYSVTLAADGNWSHWKYGIFWRYQGSSEEKINIDGENVKITSQLGQQLELYLSRQWHTWHMSLGVKQLLDDNSVISDANTQLTYHRQPRWQAQIYHQF
ncbi:MAG: TonB-dependent receptor [Saccharospirillaceae bacterium]|nr:TonB-dependent receptor [Saccharospirillaceae bacterium]